MLLNRIFYTLVLVGGALAVISPSPAIVAVAPVGNVAVVPIENGDTQLFYQTSTLTIVQYVVHGPFTTGNPAVSTKVIVPAAEALSVSPITAVTLGSGSGLEIHLYFFSKTSSLSEYIWQASTGLWNGGATCTTCLTTQGFLAKVGSKLLYSVYDSSTIRVGFVSSGVPTTISELDKGPTGAWALSQLPAVV